MHARMTCSDRLQCLRRQLCAVLFCCVAYIPLSVSAAWADSLIHVHLTDNQDKPIPNATIWLIRDEFVTEFVRRGKTVQLNRDIPNTVLAQATTDENGAAVFLFIGSNDGVFFLRAFKAFDKEHEGLIHGLSYLYIHDAKISITMKGIEVPDVLNYFEIAGPGPIFAEAGGKESEIEVTPLSDEASDER